MNGTRSQERQDREMQIRTFSVQGADGRLYEFTVRSEDANLLARMDRELNMNNRADLLFDYVQNYAGTRRLQVRVAEAEGGPWTAITDANYMRDRMFQRDISPASAAVTAEEERITATPSRTAAAAATRPVRVEEQAEAERHTYAVRIGNERYVFDFEGERPRDWADLVARQDGIIGSIAHYAGDSLAGRMDTQAALDQMFRKIREAMDARGRGGVTIEQLS